MQNQTGNVKKILRPEKLFQENISDFIVGDRFEICPEAAKVMD